MSLKHQTKVYGSVYVSTPRSATLPPDVQNNFTKARCKFCQDLRATLNNTSREMEMPPRDLFNVNVVKEPPTGVRAHYEYLKGGAESLVKGVEKFSFNEGAALTAESKKVMENIKNVFIETIKTVK